MTTKLGAPFSTPPQRPGFRDHLAGLLLPRHPGTPWTSCSAGCAIPWLVYASAAIWGLAFGGAGPLRQTAAEAAGAGRSRRRPPVPGRDGMEHRHRRRRHAARHPPQRDWFAVPGLGALVILLLALAVAVAARQQGFPDATRRRDRMAG
ncbi:hypothetical protein AB0H86_07245 [Streptomyces sp. NPDC050997]|uniref:hypothetical protein n=1 Tax=Streptomyces sp. NPDC050997 TaxID=3155519 RepID=UPI00341C570E